VLLAFITLLYVGVVHHWRCGSTRLILLPSLAGIMRASGLPDSPPMGERSTGGPQYRVEYDVAGHPTISTPVCDGGQGGMVSGTAVEEWHR
jgi:hypothetical protein